MRWIAGSDLFDEVIVLAKGMRDDAGHLAFYGAPKEAERFFGTDSLEGVLTRINRPDEGGEGCADEFIDRWEYMSGRLSSGPEE